MWYHATDYASDIMQHGFSLNNVSHGRRFGHGVYMADTSEGLAYYGSNVLELDIIGDVMEVTIDDANRIMDRLIMAYGNGYADHFGEYMTNRGYSAMCITYLDGKREMVVYDVASIRVLEVA